MCNGLNTRIYVIYHTPYITIPSEIFTRIYNKEGIVKGPVTTSDKLDNIANENPLYAEFTTLYWVWKNDMWSNYVGFFQYKRFFSLRDELVTSDNINEAIKNYGWDKENLNKLVNNYDIVLPSAINFEPKSVIEQYAGYHGREYLDVAINIINRKYPNFIEDLNTGLHGSKGYFCNMFIMRRDIFNEYMGWIMDIFNEMKREISPSYDNKHFAYLGERLFTCYIYHLKRTSSLRMIEVPLVLLYPTENNDATFTIHKND